MKKLKSLVWKVLNVMHLAGPIQLVFVSALRKNGWFNSFRTKQSINSQGSPLPWMTYSFLAFIDERLTKNHRLFEYGCGNSTHWFAERVQTINAVEHDEAWYIKISKELPDNAEVACKSLTSGNDYANEVANYDYLFDIVIIDGRERNKCLEFCLDRLSDVGVVIFDNSELKEYDISKKILKEKGFRSIDFVGMLPIVPHESCTTVFYRTNNCLNI